MIASVAGTIERVNKLITVRPVRTRFVTFPFHSSPIARSALNTQHPRWNTLTTYPLRCVILQVQPRNWRSCSRQNYGGVPYTERNSEERKTNLNTDSSQVTVRRWKVDANSRQDAVLMLSSVNLPGGIQVTIAK